MYRKRISLIVLLFSPLLALSLSCVPARGVSEREVDSFPELTGQYLGQTPPGENPKLFAPGIVSTGLYTRDVAMMPDGSELYYGVMIGPAAYTAIMVTRLVDGRWTKPEVAPFSTNPEYMDFEPAISPDGTRFYFLSNRPREGAPEGGDQDIWVMDREGDQWGEPYNLGPPVNSTDEEYFPSLTNDGTIYFTRQSTADGRSSIYRSRLVDGVYAEPEKLGPEVNSTRNQFNAFISPDETYLIVCVAGREDSHGGIDYYVSFRNEDDTWTGPINMGHRVNTASGQEFSPYVSRDGRFFFFMSARRDSTLDFSEKKLTYERIMKMHNSPGNGTPGIYWMDASFIEDLQG